MGDHDHHHHHHHDHHHGTGPLSDSEKLEKLLAHWIEHNEDHMANYREWSSKAADIGMKEVAELLEEAAKATMAVSGLFQKAMTSMQDRK